MIAGLIAYSRAPVLPHRDAGALHLTNSITYTFRGGLGMTWCAKAHILIDEPSSDAGLLTARAREAP